MRKKVAGHHTKGYLSPSTCYEPVAARAHPTAVERSSSLPSTYYEPVAARSHPTPINISSPLPSTCYEPFSKSVHPTPVNRSCLPPSTCYEPVAAKCHPTSVNSSQPPSTCYKPLSARVHPTTINRNSPLLSTCDKPIAVRAHHSSEQLCSPARWQLFVYALLQTKRSLEVSSPVVKCTVPDPDMDPFWFADFGLFRFGSVIIYSRSGSYLFFTSFNHLNRFINLYFCKQTYINEKYLKLDYITWFYFLNIIYY